MMIVCFIRSDDTRLEQELQQPFAGPCAVARVWHRRQRLSHRSSSRVCCSPTAHRAPCSPGPSPQLSAQGRARPAGPQLVLNQPGCQTGHCRNPCSHTPAVLVPCPDTRQELFYPFLEAFVVQNCTSCATSVSNSCQQCKNTEICTYLLHKTGVSSRRFRT